MSTVVNVENLLDPELRPVLDAFELPAVDAAGVAAMRSASFASPDLSDAVVRTEHQVPGDPPVAVRVHRAKDAAGLLARHCHDPRGRLCDRLLRHGQPVARSVVSRPRSGRRLRRVPPRPRDAVSGTARRLLRGVALDLRQRRSISASTRTASASTGSAPAVASPLRWRCWPVTATRSRWPSSSSTARCSMIASRRPPSGRRVSTCGASSQTSSVGGPISATLYGSDEVPPYAAAAREADLSGLPPTCVVVGSIDGFRDEDIDYAQRLNQAGVACELHVIAGLPARVPPGAGCRRRAAGHARHG